MQLPPGGAKQEISASMTSATRKIECNFPAQKEASMPGHCGGAAVRPQPRVYRVYLLGQPHRMPSP
eukprot:21778-Chlamydomonas_euryale.AAC.3